MSWRDDDAFLSDPDSPPASLWLCHPVFMIECMDDWKHNSGQDATDAFVQSHLGPGWHSLHCKLRTL